jgi:hypothetical protein
VVQGFTGRIASKHSTWEDRVQGERSTIFPFHARSHEIAHEVKDKVRAEIPAVGDVLMYI